MSRTRTNHALLVLVPAAFATGILGLLGGALGGRLVFLAHAVAGFAIVALLLPKARIIRGALRHSLSRIEDELFSGRTVPVNATGRPRSDTP